MGEIIESRRRHYVGADADKASIPAAGKEKGDSYHANDKGKQYYWDGTNWKTGLGAEYTPRNVVAQDFTQANFTLDGAWHNNGLDLSGIVPAGAVAIHIQVILTDNAANSFFRIRANDGDKIANGLKAVTQVANIEVPYIQGIVATDANRLLDYAGTAGITSIGLVVLGWFMGG